ncbi:MAG: sigma-70 family RNA polymerase sigma factor [Pseudomonadales bacterium]|nr:sigma-70 family RNA polymerase sigma factor [Pseudomonadales bacterium]
MKERDVWVFIREERNKLVSYVGSLLGGPERVDAEDVVHDVLISILERSDRLSAEYLTAYVYRALKNRVIDRARTRKPNLSIDDAEDENSVKLSEILQSLSPNPLDALRSQEKREQLFEALEKLSEIERNVVISHEFEGRSFKDLSQSWGIAQNTLLSHKSRAMKKLKRHFVGV